MSVAELPSNKSKNRYRGVYSANESRVKLQRQTFEQSDYINATYIEKFFLKATSLFIATQGPMENTVDDFWLMIWQQGVQAIVMITNIIERGKVKCEQYWPQSLTTESSYDDITVCYVSYEEWADYVVRVFFLYIEFTLEW
ncbi:hypothetical protein EB796_016747 [Bugula neritina]|uniref:protein-tyrosine-phosphatase n=1 Tax=Bugula neritina TaxID=10212 RepID=A0A7J7JFX3_BUGNE|nr:hypothetical protein EB796_016747 [Bugula neritina]